MQHPTSCLSSSLIVLVLFLLSSSLLLRLRLLLLLSGDADATTNIHKRISIDTALFNWRFCLFLSFSHSFLVLAFSLYFSPSCLSISLFMPNALVLCVKFVPSHFSSSLFSSSSFFLSLSLSLSLFLTTLLYGQKIPPKTGVNINDTNNDEIHTHTTTTTQLVQQWSI